MILISKRTPLKKTRKFTLIKARHAINIIVTGMAFATLTVQAAPSYSIKDIGMSPTAINGIGQVLGSNYMLYDNGTLSNIHAMTGVALLNQGFDINSSGQVVGYGSSYGTSAFIRNSDGTYANVGLGSDPNFRPAAGIAINDAGQVAGQSVTLNTSLYPCASHAFLGSATSPEIFDIGTLGGSRTNVMDINANGEVVGQSSILKLGSLCPLIPNYHAFVFSAASGIQDLHSTAMLGDDSIANKINSLRLVAGNFANGLTVPDLSGYYPNGYPVRHAVIWNLAAGTYRDLGNGSKDSSLLAINDSGIAVGFERTITNYACNGCGPTTTSQNAVLVDTNGTSLIDLNTLVQGMPAGWSLLKANDINKEGKIIAIARDASGVSHGVMLTPSNITVTPPPAAPNGLTSTVVSQTQIDLHWLDNATNETSQILERCQGNGCTNFSAIATLAAGTTYYSDTSLAASSQYSYRIKAHGTSGDSSYSNTVSATTLPPVVTPIPAAPSDLIATATSRSRIVLSWMDNADNEQNFLIERCQGVGCTSFSVIAQVSANAVSFNNTSLNRYTSYSYRVKAVNSAGKSAYSNVSSARTLF